MSFNSQVLDLDPAAESRRIQTFLSDNVRKSLGRRGAVVGISGGIDSSVVLALCARCFGAERVRGVIMPEKDSESTSEKLARSLAERFGVEVVVENITAALNGFSCYQRRDEAIRRVFPEYDASLGYRAKIVLSGNLLEEEVLNVFLLTVEGPDGVTRSQPLAASEFSQIVASSNFKQRTRMSMLYYHAELLHRAVIGTANKNERDLGFFVKHGDAGVDINPIAHLFKTQVFQLGEHLGVPEEILHREPTTDTYGAPSTQEEFFFRLPFQTMDLLWHAMEQEIPTEEVALAMNLSEEQVLRVYGDISRKIRATKYLRRPPASLQAARNGQFHLGAGSDTAIHRLNCIL